MASLLESLCCVDVYRILHLVAVFCLSVVLLKVIQLHQRRETLKRALEPFPGPASPSLYGQVHELHWDGYDLDTLHSWSLQYPFANPVWFGKFTVYLNITHPEYAKTLLSRTDPIENVAYHFFTPWIGEGLLVLSGQKWYQHRQLLTPGLQRNVLKPYVKIISTCTNVMLDKLPEQGTSEETIDICPHISLMTLDSILICTFSCHTNCQTDIDNPFIKAVLELTSLVHERLGFIPYYADFLFYLSPLGIRFQRGCKISRKKTGEMIKQRREILKLEENSDKPQSTREADFLDVLLRSRDENGQGLSDEDLQVELNTFMVAGHETMASGISWTLYCLAKYPEHQRKCSEEITRVLGERRTMEWDDLSLIPYTTMCIKESLRLYPPVPVLTRKLNKPMTFCDGRSVPEGCPVSVSVYSIHRNPDVWEDPEVFDPLRFSSENSAGRHSHAYLPFAAGPRSCIGQHFAMIEIQVAVALTLSHFELYLDPTRIPIKTAAITLKSRNGIYLRFESIHEGQKDGKE
ncbi:cytochrome P450 4B1-like [Bombina bombina]|uniref:cytochrome P450 4B1-like n=1 Tax=Bombina bombina TaxID=8345 RepID=UPI00235ABF4F|nr:cytochrome P450 4B1-like [Bombina bombina]